MPDATALLRYNRVERVYTVFIEPQSKSQGPGGSGLSPLASGTLVKFPRKAGVQVPGGPWHSLGDGPQPVGGIPVVLIFIMKSLRGQEPGPRTTTLNTVSDMTKCTCHL